MFSLAMMIRSISDILARETARYSRPEREERQIPGLAADPAMHR
jgi:hypothetical protein